MAEEEVLPKNQATTILTAPPRPTPTTPNPLSYTQERNQSLGLDRINAEAAYNRGWTGDGVTIGYYEIAIDGSHPELSGKVVDNPYDEIEPGSYDQCNLYT